MILSSWKLDDLAPPDVRETLLKRLGGSVLAARRDALTEARQRLQSALSPAQQAPFLTYADASTDLGTLREGAAAQLGLSFGLAMGAALTRFPQAPATSVLETAAAAARAVLGSELPVELADEVARAALTALTGPSVGDTASRPGPGASSAPRHEDERETDDVCLADEPGAEETVSGWPLPAGYGEESFERRVETVLGEDHAALMEEASDAHEGVSIALGELGFALLDRYVSAQTAVMLAREAAVAAVAYGQGVGAGGASVADASARGVGEAVVGALLEAALAPAGAIHGAAAALAALAATRTPTRHPS